MVDPHFFEDLAKKLSDSLPAGFQDLKQDLQKNFHRILQSTFSQLDLVTREEFDTQVAVLEKTREKLETLEKTVAALEASKSSSSS